jgi:EAL domain-containing protein (putative c-di-GMP-specific phosphodiesterase class I)
VAEGIETAAQAAVIRALGCDKGQGFLFSRPLSSEDLVSWLAASDGGC